MPVILSILIPAYNYCDGVKNILSKLDNLNHPELEVLIFDDSSHELVSELVETFREKSSGNLIYRKNSPRLGAVTNWNSLLKFASGEFVLLLHHDEMPLVKDFVGRAIGILHQLSRKFDVVVMECVLISPAYRILRPHLPSVLRRAIVDHIPSYLFKRNVIGPTSCMIIRRSLYPEFDNRLSWLVDVDVFYRLRQETSRWHFSNELVIGSILGRNDSITASMRGRLKIVDADERNYLLKKHPLASLWLLRRANLALNLLEEISWTLLRVITRLYYVFQHNLKWRLKLEFQKTKDDHK